MIDINMSVVLSESLKINKSVLNINGAIEDIRFVRSSVNLRVQNRKNIGTRLRSTSKTCNAIEDDIKALSGFLNFAGTQYSKAEISILNYIKNSKTIDLKNISPAFIKTLEVEPSKFRMNGPLKPNDILHSPNLKKSEFQKTPNISGYKTAQNNVKAINVGFDIYKEFWSKDLIGYKKGGSKAIAKWAGPLLTFVERGIQNFEEYKSGSIDGQRAVIETAMETTVGLAIKAVAENIAAGKVGAVAKKIAVGTVGAVAKKIAVGTVGAVAKKIAVGTVGVVALKVGLPVIVTGVVALGVAFVAKEGLDRLSQHISGKDSTELISDTMLDVVEVTYKSITKETPKLFEAAVNSIMRPISPTKAIWAL
jgi:hypothetical protein